MLWNDTNSQYVKCNNALSIVDMQNMQKKMQNKNSPAIGHQHVSAKGATNFQKNYRFLFCSLLGQKNCERLYWWWSPPPCWHSPGFKRFAPERRCCSSSPRSSARLSSVRAQVVTLFQMTTLFALGLKSSSVGAKVLLDVRRQRQNFANHNFSSSANFHG